MLGHCIVVGGKQGKRGKTQALVDGNGPLQPVTPALAMTGMPRLESSGFWPRMTLVDCVRSYDFSVCMLQTGRTRYRLTGGNVAINSIDVAPASDPSATYAGPKT